MEGVELKSPSQQEDSQISIAETIVEFQDCVEDILDEIEEDENFYEMTAENYDKKKSYLRKNLNELSRLHTLFFDQHVRLIDEVSKKDPSLIKKKHVDSSDSNSIREVSEPSSSSSLDYGPESTNKLLSSPVKEGAFNVAEAKAPEILLQKNSVVVDEPLKAKKLLEDESKFQKQMADLKLVIFESDLKIKTMEKDLDKSRKSLSIAKDTISNLKGESSKLLQENQMLKYELQSSQKIVDKASEQLNSQIEKLHRFQNEVKSYAAESTARDDKIKKLKTKNDRCKSDIKRLEEILKSKEDIWNHDVAKLKGQLKNHTKSFDELKKQLNFSRSERNRISGKLETLEDEKCSQDKLIQELETRLNTLQSEHERVVSSFEDAEKLKIELTLKVVELEGEVERQMEVISVMTKEKIEAIRHLSFSVEHYMSRPDWCSGIAVEIHWILVIFMCWISGCLPLISMAPRTMNQVKLNKSCNWSLKMDGDESKSPMQQEDSQMSPEISLTLGETIEGFQECVEDIIEEIEEDEKFSQMTAENYDKKKSYLRKHLDELSRLHRLLADQHIHLIEEINKNCPSLIKNMYLHPSDSTSDVVLRESGGFNVSEREDSEPSSLLSSGSGSESTNKHLTSTVKDDALKVKETKTEKIHIGANEAEEAELQKQVADLKLVISESNLKIETMEKELEKSRMSLSIAKELISNLKGEPSSHIFQENQQLKQILHSKQNQVNIAHDYFKSRAKGLREMDEQLDLCVATLSESDDKIKKLKTKNDRYKSDIKQLEELLKSKEDIWNHDVAKLKGQLKNHTKSFDDLKKQLNFSRSERNRISGKLETLEEERCSQDKLIQELETRLNALQIEHERVVASFEDADRLRTELTLKVAELEREVERQMEVISVITKEKIEAIRQLSFSVEHYMSKYKQLRQSSAANKTGCFSFLSGLNTQ
ncbi:hypothetical protein E3N88_03440 [Mikania micrantha]|uniref:NAB domain-containing protein n=1 Tax=Mikania micrantha TaxID=192012 RepID=A0A5N6Q6G6_9ASTR|nr:hypothetical protein E3N88_03440 [Mikania micrantha]